MLIVVPAGQVCLMWNPFQWETIREKKERDTNNEQNSSLTLSFPTWVEPQNPIEKGTYDWYGWFFVNLYILSVDGNLPILPVIQPQLLTQAHFW